MKTALFVLITALFMASAAHAQYTRFNEDTNAKECFGDDGEPILSVITVRETLGEGTYTITPCDNALAEGLVRQYYESGKVMMEAAYKNGKIEGVAKDYSEEGKIEGETPYKNGKIEGIRKGYHKNGKLAWEVSHKNGVDGIAKFYDVNGMLKNGQLKAYYENGKLKEETSYRKGILDGIVRVYYENGKLREEIPYRRGILEGTMKRYYDSGRLMLETPYKDGKIEGVGKGYRADGKPFTTITYQGGKALKGDCYKEDGSVVLIDSAEIADMNTYQQSYSNLECN